MATRAATLLGGLALLAALLGCGEHRQGQGARVRVSNGPFAIVVRDRERVVTTIGGTNAPLLFWTTDGVEHRITKTVARTVRAGATTYTLATDDPARSAAVTVETTGGAIHIDYAIERPSTVAALGFEMTASSGAHFLGTGQRLRWVDMSRTVQPLKVFNGCTSSSPSPFFASTAGFGAWVSTTAVGRIAFPGAVDDTTFACDLGSAPCSVGPPTAAVRWCFKAADAAVTIATGSVTQLVKAHARAVGLPREPWLPQFALIKWRDRISGPSELYDDIRQLRSRGIPIGWVLLDNPWEQGAFSSRCYGSLVFDPARYPDPHRMIENVHARGVRFMLWISPQIKRRDCPAPTYPDGWLTGDDQTFVRDLTFAPARHDFTDRLRKLVALGVDGFKGDRGDEVNLEPDQLAGGPGVQEQNAYPLLYDRASAAAFTSSRGRHFATLFRSFVPGSSRVLPGFVGPDAEQSYNGLAGEIRAAQNAGVVGTPVWGSDVGGYSGGTLTSNLFVRWAQFAALTPIFEVGGAGRNATFWQLGRAAVDGLRSAAQLHYELVPYLYSLAVSASRTGMPVVRPLGLEWPSDPHAWSNDLEFTVGESLLASPVTGPGTTQRVYLPAGPWIDLYSGRTYAGSEAFTRPTPASELPLFLHRSSAIPFNLRAPDVWAEPWGLSDLVRRDRAGWLVAPGGSGDASSTTAGRLAWTQHGKRLAIDVEGAPRDVQLLVLTPARPTSVAIDGHTTPWSSTSALKRASNGWTFRPAPFGGAVVKLRTSGGAAHLELRVQ